MGSIFGGESLELNNNNEIESHELNRYNGIITRGCLDSEPPTTSEWSVASFGNKIVRAIRIVRLARVQTHCIDSH